MTWLLAVIACSSCQTPPVGIRNADLSPVQSVMKFPAGQLKAGAASVDASPQTPQYLAGFGQNRKSTAVHDPITVRAVVFEQGGERVALVAIDAIGIQRHHLGQYLDKIRKVPADRVIIACTHDHSAPDTMGLWGRVLGSDGRDPEYIAFLQKKVGEAVDAAADDLAPVEIVLGGAEVRPGVVRNVRVRGLLDPEVSVMGIYPVGSQTPKSVLVNFAMHAETLWADNTIVTSDWPGYMRKHIEAATGAKVAVYFNGAQGAMVSVDNTIRPDSSEAHDFAEAERAGNAVALAAEQALAQGDRVKNPGLVFGKSIFYLPVENILYNTAARTPLITREFYRGNFQTEVNFIGLGPMELVTIPGEAYPKIGLSIKRGMNAKYKFVLGLANDELGYLLYPEDFFNDLYSYERTAGMSPHWGGLLVEKQALDLINKYETNYHGVRPEWR